MEQLLATNNLHLNMRGKIFAQHKVAYIEVYLQGFFQEMRVLKTIFKDDYPCIAGHSITIYANNLSVIKLTKNLEYNRKIKLIP